MGRQWAYRHSYSYGHPNGTDPREASSFHNRKFGKMNHLWQFLGLLLLRSVRPTPTLRQLVPLKKSQQLPNLISVESLVNTAQANAYLEQYKLVSTSWGLITQQRQTFNYVFATILGAGVAMTGLVTTTSYAAVFVKCAGIAGCIIWWQTLSKYKLLSEAKVALLKEIEKNLPLALTESQEKLLQDKNYFGKNKFDGLVSREQNLPLALGTAYFLLILSVPPVSTFFAWLWKLLKAASH